MPWPPAENVNRHGKLNAAVQHLDRKSLRQKDAARLAISLAAGLIAHHRPAFEENQAPSVLPHNVESAFEPDEVSPWLVALASQPLELLAASPRPRHQLAAAGRRVTDSLATSMPVTQTVHSDPEKLRTPRGLRRRL